MDRRKAFATAGAVSVTAIVVVGALGANVGLFGLTRHDDGPGQFALVGSTDQSPTPDVSTEGVDAPAPGVPPAPSSEAGSSSGSGMSLVPPPVAPSSGSPKPYVDDAAPVNDSGPDKDSGSESGIHVDD